MADLVSLAPEDDSGTALSQLRGELPALGSCSYLNTGTCGPMPLVEATAMQGAARTEVYEGRIGPTGFAELFSNVEQLRALGAQVLGAHSEEIAITHSTTEGMNMVLWGLAWQPGDLVATTSLEHSGAFVPLYQIARRLGLELRTLAVGNGEPERVLEAVSGLLESRTRLPRLLVISHVAWTSGAALPIAEVAKMCHEAGVEVLVDGAQSVGFLPVDVKALGADYYSVPGQKWLCGPEGTGFLYVSGERVGDVEPTFVGYESIEMEGYRPGDPSSLVFRQGAGRYESTLVYRPGIVGLREAIAWHRRWAVDAKGFERARKLAGHCRERALELQDVEVLTPPEQGGLIALRLPGGRSNDCVAELVSRGILVRHIPDSDALRVSCGFYNTYEEVDAALEAVARFLAGYKS
jgi:L-cysteine/cystine lyase